MPKIKSQIETIAAIATPVGESGIGVIRISGQQACKALEKIFISKKLTESKGKLLSHYFYFGWIVDFTTGKKVDQAMVVFMQKPRSFTGEDMVEFHCHGSQVVLHQVLNLVLQGENIRLAEPGEFTKRAFLNGKLDLAQAESVIDIIEAQTSKSAQLAVEQLEGGLSKKVRMIYEDVLYVLGYLEATFDFVDDDIPKIPFKNLQKRLKKAKSDLKKLLDSAAFGFIYKQGVKIVLIGFPNAGKSSLFNALLEQNRAIVTDIPGTTRDTLREYIDIRGLPVILIDTAGITKSEHEIEKESLKRSFQAIKSADVILLVFEAMGKMTLPEFKQELSADIWQALIKKKIIYVINKTDQIKQKNKNFTDIEYILQKEFQKSVPIVLVSAKKRTGIEKLRENIKLSVLGNQKIGSEDILITNQRHKQNLEKALEHLSCAMKVFQEKVSLDLLSVDLRFCLEALGEITGEVVTEEILDNIFSRFCIGK